MTELPKAFSPDVLAALAKPAERFDSRNAELLPNVAPQWYVIEVWPGAERKVADELTARRFGIYIPGEEVTMVRRGRKFEAVELLFPGYIFVFVWDVLRHRGRIESIDGVLRVILDVNGVPLFLSDREIDKVRYLENQHRPIQLEQFSIEVDPPRKKRKRRQKRVVITVSDEVVSTRPWGWVRSTFDDTLDESIVMLDSHGRNQTLMRALGLCS
jgi:transcription antitermination factor NusG